MILESEASTASSSISHHNTPVRSSSEKVQHKRKRRRRRRIENDTHLNGSGESESMHILEKASNTTAQESTAVSSSTPTSSPLPSSQEEITNKKRYRKSRRRRKQDIDTTIKDDVFLSLSPNRTKGITLQNTTLDDKLVQSTEELENNPQICSDGDSDTVISATLNKETLTTNNDKDDCEAVKTDDALLSQSQSNATNNKAEEVTAQEIVRSAKVTDRKQNTTQNKKKATSNKIRNASSSTGKEGECLRRIKHEWKNAVKSGIAYDWINMKTIRNTNTANSAYVRIGPFGKNLLRWHFSVAGPANSVYENGIYHGRVLLPKDYPASPPRVQMITPSGRFIPGEDICLSASSYHPETWSPRWTVLSLVDALRLHMLTTANEIGGVLASDEKRRQYAVESRSWKCHGIANHERMVTENIFSIRKLERGEEDDDNDCKEEANSDESVIVNSDDVTDEVAARNQSMPSPSETTKDTSMCSSATKKKSKKHPNKGKKRKQKTAVPSIVSNDEEPTKRTSKKKKSSSKKKSTGTDNQSNDVAPIAHTVVKEKKRSRESATDIQTQERDQSILKIVSKWLLVEMLKLPLRVLAILIRILDRFENYMRAILDSM